MSRCSVTTASVSSSGSGSSRPRATSSWVGPKVPATGRNYYIRQLWDFKGQGDPMVMDAGTLSHYGALCAWILARSHARTGDAVKISGYLGKASAFDRAIAAFAGRYAITNEADYAAFVDAVGQ